MILWQHKTKNTTRANAPQIEISEKQDAILQQIIRRSSSPQSLVLRAKIVRDRSQRPWPGIGGIYYDGLVWPASFRNTAHLHRQGHLPDHQGGVWRPTIIRSANYGLDATRISWWGGQTKDCRQYFAHVSRTFFKRRRTWNHTWADIGSTINDTKTRTNSTSRWKLSSSSVFCGWFEIPDRKTQPTVLSSH